MTTAFDTSHLTLGQRLFFARQIAGIEQQKLAPMLGVSRATLASWESGRANAPFVKVVALARLTQQPVEWFAEAVDHKSEG